MIFGNICLLFVLGFHKMILEYVQGEVNVLKMINAYVLVVLGLNVKFHYVLVSLQMTQVYVQVVEYVFQQTNVNALKIGLMIYAILQIALEYLEMIHKFVQVTEYVMISILVFVRMVGKVKTVVNPFVLGEAKMIQVYAQGEENVLERMNVNVMQDTWEKIVKRIV